MNFFFQSSIKFFFVNDDNSWVTFWMIILSDCEWIFNQPFIHLKFFLFTEKKILWNLISIVDFKYVWSVVVSVCLFLCHISFSKSNPVLVWLLFDLIHCYCCCCLSMETTVTYFFFLSTKQQKVVFFSPFKKFNWINQFMQLCHFIIMNYGWKFSYFSPIFTQLGPMIQQQQQQSVSKVTHVRFHSGLFIYWKNPVTHKRKEKKNSTSFQVPLMVEKKSIRLALCRYSRRRHRWWLYRYCFGPRNKKKTKYTQVVHCVYLSVNKNLLT